MHSAEPSNSPAPLQLPLHLPARSHKHRQLMSRQQYQPALSVLLQAQAQQTQQSQPQSYEGTRLTKHAAASAYEQGAPPILSPYRNKQSMKGLGRQQTDAQAQQRKSAKGQSRDAACRDETMPACPSCAQVA